VAFPFLLLRPFFAPEIVFPQWERAPTHTPVWAASSGGSALSRNFGRGAGCGAPKFPFRHSTLFSHQASRPGFPVFSQQVRFRSSDVGSFENVNQSCDGPRQFSNAQQIAQACKMPCTGRQRFPPSLNGELVFFLDSRVKKDFREQPSSNSPGGPYFQSLIFYSAPRRIFLKDRRFPRL